LEARHAEAERQMFLESIDSYGNSTGAASSATGTASANGSHPDRGRFLADEGTAVATPSVNSSAQVSE
jgi:hypothetical protein